MSLKRLRRFCSYMLLPALLSAFHVFTTNPVAGQEENRQYLPLIVRPGAATQDPTPEPTPGPAVTARNFSGYYDLGDYFLMGEVVNNGTVPLYNIELAVIYRNAAGEIIATGEAAPSLDRVEPGDTAPVRDVHFGAPQGIAQYTISVEGWAAGSLVDYRPLTIVRAEKQRGSFGVTVSGQVRNDSGQSLESVLLVASFRNSSGVVVAVEYDYPVIGSLQPGQTVDYTIETFDDSLAEASVRVQGQGSVAP